MIYQDANELLEKIKEVVPEDYSVYEKYVEKAIISGLLDFYKDLNIDIFKDVFVPIIGKSKAKDQTYLREEQTAFLMTKIDAMNKAKSLSKKDMLEVANELLKLSHDLYNEQIAKKEANKNIEAYNLSLCSELNFKILFMLNDNSLALDIVKHKGKNNIQTAKRIFDSLMDNIKNENQKYIDENVSEEKQEIINNVREYHNDTNENFNGHNLYAWLNNIPKKDQVLIKHILITMSNKKYFKEKRYPKDDELIDANDYLIFIKEFDIEKILKDVNREIVDHANDNIDVRYLTKIIGDEDVFHYALATSSLIILDYRKKEYLQELKDNNELFTEEELKFFNTLDEETKDFIVFIKQHLNRGDIINIGNQEMINNVSNYVNTIKSINDIEKLDIAFQAWVDSINLDELTDEQFETLMKLDSKYIYDRLPLASRVIFKRREEIPEGWGKETFYSKEEILKANTYRELSKDNPFSKKVFVVKDGITPIELFKDKEEIMTSAYLFSIHGVPKITKYFIPLTDKIKVNGNMKPISEFELFASMRKYNPIFKEELLLEYLMYNTPLQNDKLYNYCIENNIKFYPEMFCIPWDPETKGNLKYVSYRLGSYYEEYPNEKLSSLDVFDYFREDNYFRIFMLEKELSKHKEVINKLMELNNNGISKDLIKEQKEKMINIENALNREKEKMRVENEYLKLLLEEANDNKASDINKNRGR